MKSDLVGKQILVKHHTTGRIINYLVVNDPVNEKMKLVNLTSNNIMANFSAENDEEIWEYIEKLIICTVIEVV